jgi:hypothetical protein
VPYDTDGSNRCCSSCTLLDPKMRVPSQPIMEHYRGLRLPSEVHKLRRWLDNIRQHPVIHATQRHPEGDQKYEQELMRHYSKYAGECQQLVCMPAPVHARTERRFQPCPASVRPELTMHLRGADNSAKSTSAHDFK